MSLVSTWTTHWQSRLWGVQKRQGKTVQYQFSVLLSYNSFLVFFCNTLRIYLSIKCICMFLQERRRQREHRLEDLHGSMYTWPQDRQDLNMNSTFSLLEVRVYCAGTRLWNYCVCVYMWKKEKKNITKQQSVTFYSITFKTALYVYALWTVCMELYSLIDTFLILLNALVWNRICSL